MKESEQSLKQSERRSLTLARKSRKPVQISFPAAAVPLQRVCNWVDCHPACDLDCDLGDCDLDCDLDVDLDDCELGDCDLGDCDRDCDL